MEENQVKGGKKGTLHLRVLRKEMYGQKDLKRLSSPPYDL